MTMLIAMENVWHVPRKQEVLRNLGSLKAAWLLM